MASRNSTPPPVADTGHYIATNAPPRTSSPLRQILSRSHSLPLSPSADDVHMCSLVEVEGRLRTTCSTGLSSSDAAARLVANGANVLSRPPYRWMETIVRYLFGGFCWLLWIAAIVTFLAWKPLGEPNPAEANFALGLLLIIVIVLQAVFGAVQDWTSSRVMSKIESMLPKFATVRRDGIWQQVPSSDIVTGDIVKLKYGNKSPADVRIISTAGLKVDASILTGEAVPVEVTAEQTSDVPSESRNVVLMGSFAMEGEGEGVVFATGDRTLMGRVARLANASNTAPTILQREISRFVFVIAAMALTTASICLIIWATWLRVDYPDFLSISAMLSNDMGVLVAFVPEGLPIAVTLILLIMAQRMRRRRILVKSLTTVETLGSVNLVCTDKTGTITTNCMTVAAVAVGDQAAAIGFGERGLEGAGAARLLLSARLCNSASFDPSDVALPLDSRRVNGDATDAALLRFAHRPAAAPELVYEQQGQVPFSSKAKWMAVVVSPSESCVPGNIFLPGSTRPLLIVKGAPEVLLPSCSQRVLADAEGTVANLDEEARTALTRTQEQWSRNGQRVLLMAYRVLDDGEQSKFTDHASLRPLLRDLVIIGLLGIVDPPRPEAAGIVTACRRAGMRFFMITGDFALTGEAISRSVGIITAPVVHHLGQLRLADPQSDASSPVSPANVHDIELAQRSSSDAALVLTGAEVATLGAEQWDAVSRYTEVVFARTTPEHKLQIVKEMRARGCIVAVTGDGVNDAPALKHAHIGVAMGAGSDVAMESAAMILLDSNLSSIIEAVRQGRTVFDNLKKVCVYLLPAGSFSELTPILFNILFGVPLPLSGFLMIFICVITDMAPALSLMFEHGESDLLERAPRNPTKDPLVNWKLILHSYLFIGIIETFFAHLFYFLYMRNEWGVTASELLFAFNKWGVDGYAGLTAAEQITANATGQSVYFIALIIMQIGNLLATRTRHQSIFSNPPWHNPALFVGIVVELVLAVALVYGPAFQTLLGSGDVPAMYWFIPLPISLLILVLDELRKLVIRRYPDSSFARVAW